MSWLSNLFSKDEQQPSEASSPPKPMATAADYCEQGQKTLDAAKYIEAMEYFQAAIEADNRFEKAYLLLATAYEKQGKTDKANIGYIHIQKIHIFAPSEVIENETKQSCHIESAFGGLSAAADACLASRTPFFVLQCRHTAGLSPINVA